MRPARRSPSLTLPPPHVFDQGNPAAERNTRWAVLLTVVVMVAEIIGGVLFNSMALLADGWHMSSHALALGLSLLAYAAARRFARDGRFTFGTWKIEVLGGYTSALCLVGVAGLMLYHSVQRLFAPVPIHYDSGHRWPPSAWWSTWSAPSCCAISRTITTAMTITTTTTRTTTVTRT